MKWYCLLTKQILKRIKASYITNASVYQTRDGYVVVRQQHEVVELNSVMKAVLR